MGASRFPAAPYQVPRSCIILRDSYGHISLSICSVVGAQIPSKSSGHGWLSRCTALVVRIPGSSSGHMMSLSWYIISIMHRMLERSCLARIQAPTLCIRLCVTLLQRHVSSGARTPHASSCVTKSSKLAFPFVSHVEQSSGPLSQRRRAETWPQVGPSKHIWLQRYGRGGGTLGLNA